MNERIPIKLIGGAFDGYAEISTHANDTWVRPAGHHLMTNMPTDLYYRRLSRGVYAYDHSETLRRRKLAEHSAERSGG